MTNKESIEQILVNCHSTESGAPCNYYDKRQPKDCDCSVKEATQSLLDLIALAYKEGAEDSKRRVSSGRKS